MYRIYIYIFTARRTSIYEGARRNTVDGKHGPPPRRYLTNYMGMCLWRVRQPLQRKRGK